MVLQKINIRFTVLLSMIFLAAFSRCIPHMPNFSPLGAIGLFGAAYFGRKWQAFLLPLMATWLSDLFINNIIYSRYYHGFVWIEKGFYWIYGTYLLITIAGLFILRRITAMRITLAALASTTIFYIVTNFACWPGSKIYTHDLSGLTACYIAGIPFLKGTALGDLFYTVVLFGSFSLAQRGFPSLRITGMHMPERTK